MSQSEWYAIEPRGEWTADSDRAWHKTFDDEQTCRECHSRLPQYSANPIDITLMGRPDNAPVVVIQAVPASLIRADFLDVLKPHMKDFLIGTVHGPERQCYDDFCTCTAAHVLPLRGTVASILGTCNTCGALRYYPMPYEKEYIVKDSLVLGKLVYRPSLGSLVIHEEVHAKIPESILRKLRVKQIPVRQDALDGIKHFPTLPP